MHSMPPWVLLRLRWCSTFLNRKLKSVMDTSQAFRFLDLLLRHGRLVQLYILSHRVVHQRSRCNHKLSFGCSINLDSRS